MPIGKRASRCPASTKAMGEPHRGARPQRREDLNVQLVWAASEMSRMTRSEARITSNCAEGAVLLAEARRPRPLERARSGPQADRDLDGAVQGVAQVLRLGGSLRSPADHADLVDAVERAGKPVEKVPAAADDHLRQLPRVMYSLSNTAVS